MLATVQIKCSNVLDNVVYLIGIEMLMHRKSYYRVAMFFTHREITNFVSEMGCGWLQMEWNRVMDFDFNTMTDQIIN